MRLSRVLGAVAALGLVAAGLAGCGSATTEVHAPEFTVPDPPPLTQQGRPGSAGQANTFLTNWMHGLREAADPEGRAELAGSCHDDPGCLRLIRAAAKLPKPSGDVYYENWSVGFTQAVQADPKHSDSWTVVIRPTWVTYDTLLDGRYDGWTTRTPVRVRLALVGQDVQTDWRLWLTPLPAGSHAAGGVQLSHPKYGEI
ncbi:hypothetical protein AB0I55_31440 [Actinocatenispora sera]|uniref:hypothetical protein n=1 Tax=Actinocatenispora sera TaxID=390989 RepID=UPI003409431C